MERQIRRRLAAVLSGHRLEPQTGREPPDITGGRSRSKWRKALRFSALRLLNYGFFWFLRTGEPIVEDSNCGFRLLNSMANIARDIFS
jgi:hypothetical protein